MKIKFRLEIEHLQGFMNYRSSISDPESSNKARGECFYRSAALVIDVPAWELCIGTLPGVPEKLFRAYPQNSPTDFMHCWVEFGKYMIDPTWTERDNGELVEYHWSEYHEIYAVRDVYKIEGRRFKILAKAHGWDRFFLTGNPFKGSPIVPTLLTEAAVPYEESSRGGIVPPGTIMPDYAR